MSDPPPQRSPHHEIRNANNSAAFLLPRLANLTPIHRMLDVGCGTGTITASFIPLLPENTEITGIDSNPTVLERARHNAPGITFIEGDGHALPFPDNHFDIAWAHQVLVWTPEQPAVIAEMLRVVRPGGFIAIREGDYMTEVVTPEIPALFNIYPRVVSGAMEAQAGVEAKSAGRRLLDWSLRAGAKREEIELSFSTWCFAEPADRGKWSQGLINISREGKIRDTVLKEGIVTEAELEEVAAGWAEWAEREDASLAMMHGEVIITKL